METHPADTEKPNAPGTVQKRTDGGKCAIDVVVLGAGCGGVFRGVVCRTPNPGGKEVAPQGGSGFYAPVGVGGSEQVFHDADGPEFVDNGGDESLADFRVFAGHDEDLAGEAVIAGVEARDAAPFLRFGSGGLLRVGAICLDLLFAMPWVSSCQPQM